MRPLLPMLLAPALACGATDRPAPPAPPEPGGQLAPAAPAAELEGPAGKRVAATADPAATGAQQYVGLRSPDLLLEVPEPLRPRGERVLDDHGNLGLVAVGMEGGGELVFLDRRTDEGDFIVEAVLEMPAGVTSEQVAWDQCKVGGKLDSRLVAVVPAGAGCIGEGVAATLAWRVDRQAKRFVAIAPDDIRCRPPMCPDPVDNPVPVEGGVRGGILEGGVPGGIEGGIEK